MAMEVNSCKSNRKQNVLQTEEKKITVIETKKTRARLQKGEGRNDREKKDGRQNESCIGEN